MYFSCLCLVDYKKDTDSPALFLPSLMHILSPLHRYRREGKSLQVIKSVFRDIDTPLCVSVYFPIESGYNLLLRHCTEMSSVGNMIHNTPDGRCLLPASGQCLFGLWMGQRHSLSILKCALETTAAGNGFDASVVWISLRHTLESRVCALSGNCFRNLVASFWTGICGR